jgi:sulfite exporter TauE/SafE
MDEGEARLWWAVILFALSVPTTLFFGMNWGVIPCAASLLLLFI